MDTGTPRSRKRQLEPEDDEYGEGADNFDTDGGGATRRGRKEGRRVSGVYREIRSLHSIGNDMTVMQMVFRKLSLKDVMLAGSFNVKWYITAMHELRRRYGDNPILRLWNSEKSIDYLWIEWQLHFHEQLLDGIDMDEPMEECGGASFRSIDSIISIGSRAAYGQFTHEDAKLPFSQDHIYMICGDAIVTTPDFSYTGTADKLFGSSSMAVQSFFIPKSRHITLKAFGLESSKDDWPLDQIKGKVDFPVEDVGAGQKLSAVLCCHYIDCEATKKFVDNFAANYTTVGLLSGFAEEIGSNRISSSESAITVGFSIYAGVGANVSVYEVDFEKEDSADVLFKMEKQAKSKPYGFCFVFAHDDRNWITVPDKSPIEEGQDWSDSIRPESKVDDILMDLRSRMPKTPIFGVYSLPSVTAMTIDKSNSNVNEKSESRLCYGFLLVSYDAE